MYYEKPFETPIVNIPIGHTHAEGLIAHYLFNGSGKTVYDVTNNQNNLSVVGAEYVPKGLKFIGNGEYSSFNNTRQRINSEEGTIIIKFKSLSEFSNSTRRCLFGHYKISSGVFTISKFPDNYLYFLLRDDVREHWIRITEPAGWESGVQITALWNRTKNIWNNDNIVLNINGINITPQSQSYETSWNSFTIDTSLYVGNDASNTNYYCDGIIEYLSIRDTVIRAELLQGIYENPHEMLQYV